jgi:hypothetical protein
MADNNEKLSLPSDTLLEGVIESVMKTLNKTILWIILSLSILSISIYGEYLPDKPKEFEIFGIKIQQNSANVVIFLFLFVVNLYIYKLFRTIRDCYRELTDKKNATFLLQRHPLVTNPYSKSSGGHILFYDYLGYAILFILWWGALDLGIRMLLSVPNPLQKSIAIFFAILYAIVGLFTRNAINAIAKDVNQTKWKSWMTFIGVIIALAAIYFLNKDLL